MSIYVTHLLTKNPLINFLILRNNDLSKLQINNIKKMQRQFKKSHYTSSKLKESHER